MRAVLVRVGVDQSYGHWNGPFDPQTREFIYVPIPESVQQRRGMRTDYRPIAAAVEQFGASRGVPDLRLPSALRDDATHLDPDFSSLTYGDNGERRGNGLFSFERGDFLVFYAGLRSIDPADERLVYALIGLYRFGEVVRAGDVERARQGENAHTRRIPTYDDDVIVRATRRGSGRLVRAIPIGELRDRSYRVREDLLTAWGGLSCKDGFIQRSAVLPRFLRPERFLRWWEKQDVELVAENNPMPKKPAAPPVILVMLRQPWNRESEQRTDPLYEFGSFGLTGCHNGNLLASDAADGARLGFVQGGPGRMRLVMLTPPVKIVRHPNGVEAAWRSASMPLKFEDAPLLVDRWGKSEVPGMLEALRGGRRSTLSAQFASNFRSRLRPLEPRLAASVVKAWEEANRDRIHRAKSYWEALPRPPPSKDEDREGTYRGLLRRAGARTAPAKKAKRNC